MRLRYRLLPKWVRRYLSRRADRKAAHDLAVAAASGIHEAMGRATGIYKFAEPETNWEAFISGKPSQERRNLEIWREFGRKSDTPDDEDYSI